MTAGLREPDGDEVWRAAAVVARDSLLAVGRGERTASRRDLEEWERTLTQAEAWGLA